jgi:hypothetical protein
MEFKFIYDDEISTFVPVLVLGAGTGTDSNGQAHIYKREDGLHIVYYKSDDGTPRRISLLDDGIEFEPGIGGALKTGVVDAINEDNTVDILIEGDVLLENVPYLTSYTPTEGDTIIYGETI